MQEVDAERRIQILRGIRPENPLAEPQIVEESSFHKKPRHDRKRRRLVGEDDTDRDLRLAREHNKAASQSTQALVKSIKGSDAPLIDHKGHIDLFPAEGPKHHAPKNAEAEAEAAKKNKEYEDQYTMRFSNAAGFKQSVGQKPWYSSMRPADGREIEVAISKDLWGNEDPRRKERERMRLASDDPMAAIQKGVSELRQVERERQKWKEERDMELRSIVQEERRQERVKRHKAKDVDDLEGFNLDAPVASKGDDRNHRHRSHHRRHRSKSKERSRHNIHHQSDRISTEQRAVYSGSTDLRKEKHHNQVPTPRDDTQ